MLHNKQKEKVLGALLWDLKTSVIDKERDIFNGHFIHLLYPCYSLIHSYDSLGCFSFSIIKTNFLISRQILLIVVSFTAVFRVGRHAKPSPQRGALHREECSVTTLKKAMKETILIGNK